MIVLLKFLNFEIKKKIMFEFYLLILKRSDMINYVSKVCDKIIFKWFVEAEALNVMSLLYVKNIC
jgi:hypothetical protein